MKRAHCMRPATGLTAAITFALLFTLAAESAAAPSADLRSGLAAFAKSISALLKSPLHKQDAIGIGEFTGPSSEITGTGISQALAEELGNQGIRISGEAKYTVKGDFAFPKADDGTRLLRIQAEVVDNFGEVIANLNTQGGQKDAAKVEQGRAEIETDDERSILRIAPVNAHLVGHVSKPDRNRQVFDPAENAAHLAGDCKVSSDPESPYAMEILVDGTPRTVDLEGRAPSVDIARGGVYEVKLYNNSPHDAAVELLIDGVDCFAFSELRFKAGPEKGQPMFRYWVIPAGESFVVKGWHRTNEVADGFQVVGFAQGRAAELLNDLDQQKNPNLFGTVKAIFSAAWPINGSPPPDEPPARRGTNLTGKGPPRKVNLQPMQRQVGVPRAAVTIRYSKAG